MGLRRRSIRLRIFFLILIPLLSLIGLYIFVASITVNDAVNEARASSLKNDTGLPIGLFERQIYSELRTAMIYLAAPTPQRLAQLDAQEARTDHLRSSMRTAVSSHATMDIASAQEKQAIAAMLYDASGLGPLRSRIASRAIGPQQAMNAYNSIVAHCESALRTVISRESDAGLVTQALALMGMGESENALLQEDAVLQGAFAARSFTAADRHEFAELAGGRRALLAASILNLNAAERSFYTHDVDPRASASLTSLEDRLIADPRTSGPPSVQPASWQSDITAVSRGFTQAGTRAAGDLTNRAKPVARAIYLRLILAGGLGLIAVIVSVFVSIWIGRGLVRQLAELRRSALTLATEQLPRVVQRLRAGEDVDVAAEAPPIAAAADEIGLVSRALNTVQRTAIEAAVDQARLRRGISDVFRNLARRSQSLLHRQLAMLDSMERRATEPDELSDLYRLDHLTTRMRRHAEGLIILSGAAPGRSWRKPVRLVDVLRAAVAEIEDYTRVTVVTMTDAALAGPAVADVIHLIAELVENATIFSPPNTPVRLTGDIVGKGFAVEIEDRGLGLAEEKLAEINNRLANPPEFDLSDSDQLGLFVAGQLAVRHGIRVSLRPNPYGGTTVIVLIPHELVVSEQAYARDTAGTLASETAVRPTGRHASRSEDIIAAATQSAALNPPPATTPSGAYPYAPDTPDVGARADNGSAGSDLSGSQLSGVGLAGSGPVGTGPVTVRPVGDGAPSGAAAAGREEDATDSGAQAATSGISWFQRTHPDEWPGEPQAQQADTGPATAERTELGLPRRIRQASLAPELRKAGPPGAVAGDQGAGDFPSPEIMRATMTAIQRGWERGRSSFAAPDDEPDQPAATEPDGSAAAARIEE